MQVRPIVTALALVAGATAFAAPTTPPAPFRYTLTEVIHREVDLTAAGAGKQVEHASLTRFVSLTFGDSAGGRTVRLVVDSVRLDTIQSQAPIDQAALDSLRGVSATAWIGADGTLQQVQSDSARGTIAATALTSFFPKVAPGVRVGTHWSDTTESRGTGDQLLAASTVRRITNWAVNGEVPVGGIKSRKIEAAFSQSVTGELQTPQGAVGIDGTGTGSATYFMAADGRPMGMTSTLTLALTVSTSQLPEPIPVSGVNTTTITPIR